MRDIMFISLESVGCVINTKTMLVHTKFDGLNNGVHIDDVSEEWMNSLSIKDFVMVGKVIGVLK